jgi:hypothetical protein
VAELDRQSVTDADEGWVVVHRLATVNEPGFADLVARAAASIARQPEFLQAVEARIEEAAVQDYVSSLWADDWNSNEDAVYDEM